MSLVSSFYWVTFGSCPAHINPPSTMQDYITYYLFILFYFLSILVNPWLISPVSWDQDLLIPVCPIHNYIKCMTGIFSIFTGNDAIHDSCLLDIVSPLRVEDIDLVQLSVNLCVIAEFSRVGIYKIKITGKDIAKASRDGIYKPSIKAEILQHYQ